MLFKTKSSRQFKKDQFPTLQSSKIQLRFPEKVDYAHWSKLRLESRLFLEPWEPLWPDNAHTYDTFKNHLIRFQKNRHDKSDFVFFIFENETNELIGGISLGNIRRGVVQNAQIGYWCGEKFSGRGFMRESLKLMIEFAFKYLKLHRLEAVVLPINIRSICLLERCGFMKEGQLRSCVKINGEWQDHVLYALLATDEPAQ